MKFLQIVLNCISLALLLVAVVVVVALMPDIQTWWVQSQLSSHPDIHGTVEGVSARFGEVEIVNLHLDIQGAKLTLPALQAGIPLTKSAWTRLVEIRRLVAKGWTLDLSHYAAVAQAQSPQPGGDSADQAPGTPGNSPAQVISQTLAGLLSRWELPCAATVDGVDLEGDVLTAAPPGSTPARMHVVISGGGMASGREGTFAITLSDYDPRLPADLVSVHGTLKVAMDTPRTIHRLGIKAEVSALGAALPENLSMAMAGSATREDGAQVLGVDLSRAGRHVAGVVARVPDSGGRITGTWNLDVRNTDLAPFVSDTTLPPLESSGDGSFDAEPGFVQLHASGRLHAVASHLGVLTAALDPLGTVTLDSRFDLTRSGSTIRLERCSLALGGSNPTVTAKALQPFSFDAGTRKLALDNPGGDWAEVSASRLPLPWLSGFLGRLSFTGGEANGAFFVRQAGDGTTFRPEGAATASDVSAQYMGRTFLRKADVSANVAAGRDSKGWQAEFSPLVISSAGRELVTFRANASQPSGEDQPIAVAGTWSANPQAIAAVPTIPGLGWIRGSSASGDLKATIASWGELDTKFAVEEVAPGTSISGTGHADVGLDGSVSFVLPVKIATGTSVSDLDAEGSLTPDAVGPRLEAKLTGGTVSLDHLRLLAGTASLSRGGDLFASGGGPDRIPFWGNWSGRVSVDIDHLKALGHDFTEATGRLDWDPGVLRLKNGRAVYARHNLAKVEGSIVFDPSSGQPYGLDAKAEVSDFDASKFFVDPQFGKDAFIDGHFAISATSTGRGGNLRDLKAGARNVLLVSSSGGIIRFLKTSVAEAIPEAPAKATDSLAKVGSTVGSIFGGRRKDEDQGSNPVSKNAEAVLDFTYAASEIGYDDLTVTAILGADRVIHLAKLAITAPEERVAGSGEIGWTNGLGLRDQPLSMDLVISARGDTGGLLAKAGLLSDNKDDLGYAALVQPVHFGGTLAHLDTSQWHALLVKAATRKPEPEKKSQ